MADNIQIPQQAAQPELNSEQTKQAAQPSEDIFAKKEKYIRKLQEDLKKEREEFESKRKSYETDYIPKSRLKEDPLSVLMDEGISYDSLSEMMLQNPGLNDPTTRTLLNKIKALEERYSNSEKSRQEEQQNQYKKAIEQIGQDVKHLVDKDPEFESIKESQAYDAVVELIEQTFNTEGRLMSVAEAAKEVENHLVEQAFKMSQWKKVQARMQPKVEAPQEVQKPQTMEPKPAIRTLSNDLTQQSSGRMTEKQRIARAMAAFNGQKIS